MRDVLYASLVEIIDSVIGEAFVFSMQCSAHNMACRQHSRHEQRQADKHMKHDCTRGRISMERVVLRSTSGVLRSSTAYNPAESGKALQTQLNSLFVKGLKIALHECGGRAGCP